MKERVKVSKYFGKALYITEYRGSYVECPCIIEFIKQVGEKKSKLPKHFLIFSQ